MMSRGFLVLILILVLPPEAAWSQTPVGGEFQVNSYTTNTQSDAFVEKDADGDFVVVWTSYEQDGSEKGVFGQRFSSDGTAQGGEFQVNSYTTGRQTSYYLDGLAMAAGGDFVVVWQSPGQDGDGIGIFGQRFAAGGTRVGSEFQVNSYTTDSQSVPSVAMDPDGDFVVVWGSNLQDGSSFGVFGQRFAASGTFLGIEFQVNSYTTGSQGIHSAAMDAQGDFVVV